MTERVMASVTSEDKVTLDADTVFLLMKKGFPISRNVRAQWLLEHLDTAISIQYPPAKCKEAPELETVSVLPRGKPESWSPETSHQFLYIVTPTTTIVFLAHKYKIVFNLDLSPSLATVDIQNGEIVIDEVYMATKRFLEGITRPFTIPGSKRVMRPEIYVTIIAHTPFFLSPAQQVLVQGCLVTADNIHRLTQFLERQLNVLEKRVATVTAVANQELETLRAESERLVGGLFEETTYLNKNSNCIANTSMVSPESSFVNMLRYGMLALTLLPEHSCAHMIVVSDGVVGTTDIHMLDSVMQQLRATTVACSFIHVGSAYHPHCADGLVPYQDLLHFLATATLGSYMSFVPQPVPTNGIEMNLYHKNFLCWQLYRDTVCELVPDAMNWQSKNSLFHEQKSAQFLRKKQVEDKVTCTLNSLLCCRLREGYLIKRANIRDDILEICFVLLWKSNVSLEYFVTCPWSSKSLSSSNVIQYTITIDASYEFLHDITCLSKKPLKSQYRQGVVSRFWTALTSLTESDNMLAHFSWFPGSEWTWYSVPDTIRSGMPVFYLSACPSPNTVQLRHAACPQFGQIWQPVVSLDAVQWARWMHTQRVTLILSHDRPLPRHLHQANQSGRFQCVQSRQAAAVLYAMLKNWATFVLVENHTYVQFIYREAEKPPVSFSLIRINCKALCVVLNIAFAGGTEGVVRHNVVIDLVDRLSKLTLPNRPTEQRETPSCIIVHKPLEKILIRYERMPTDLSLVLFPDGTQANSVRSAPILGGTLTTTLSRYLYHNRWLWHVKRPFVQTIPGITLPRLNITAIARILSTITKMRLAEGFSFAYSAAGIINMVLEVQMQDTNNDAPSYPSVIQYILFPPHVISSSVAERDSGSEEDTDEGTADGEVSTEDCEGSGDFQIVTEAWIEPQCGVVQPPVQPTASYLRSLQYHELAEAIARVDEECINALLTLEHLSLLSQVVAAEKSTEIVYGQEHQDVKLSEGSSGMTRCDGYANSEEFLDGTTIIDDRIHAMHFSFDTLSILPKCQQAELFFSMFAYGSAFEDEGGGSANRILMDNFLEHMKQLHNKELLFTSAESQRFTEMLFNRPREEGPPLAFFSHREGNGNSREPNSYPRWKCFVKGVSTTHVIITILPASEKDVRLFMYPTNLERSCSNSSERNCETGVFNLDLNEKNAVSPGSCTRQSNPGDTLENDAKLCNQSTDESTPKSDVQGNFAPDPEGCLVIPVYVYDCSLALLIETLVEKLKTPRNKDIYQDHTFRIGQQECEDCVELKSECNTKPSSPEPKSEDSDNISNDQRSLMEHCKLLSLAHCNCYVVAVYKSLVLQEPLSYEDMEAAVEQCEENFIEINITNYLSSVCRHLSKLPEGNLLNQLKVSACNDVKPLHNLIKEKFGRIITVAFRPVPAHPEFYYCSPPWVTDKMDMESQKTDSDDDLEDFAFHSEIIDCKSDNPCDKGNITWPATNLRNIPKAASHDSTEYLISEVQDEHIYDREQPLFLQLSCSVHFRSGLNSIPVKLLPTCFTEIIQRMDDYKEKDISDLNPANLKITLDIICLNLPREVLEISLERSPELRTTSFCSGSPLGSLRTESGSSPGNNTRNETLQERMAHLPLNQQNAINSLTSEIEWLLQDESATAFLDRSTVGEETLRFVANHVAESSDRTSCKMEKVPLHFVFPSEDSRPKFLKELSRVRIDRYCIKQEGTFFYFIKGVEEELAEPPVKTVIEDTTEIKKGDSVEQIDQEDRRESLERYNAPDIEEPPGCYSEISSLAEGKLGTEDGYEGDSSNCEDEYQWLVELDRRRKTLPNFWLILNVENDHVNVYFHCRFLEITAPEVDRYWQTHKMLITQIKDICRRVNQYLLLQSLYDTRKCSELLETETNEDYTWKSDSLIELGHSIQNPRPIQNVTPGMFQCPVICKIPFCLHPRLKTGPGRSGLSRGIKALHGVLNRFSVNNRNNLFVYKENNKNVFYLRLHEQTNDGKGSLQNKLSESDEKLTVSRSNSVVSLSQTKTSDNGLTSDTRPRVRSFGEKESDVLNKSGDSIILMVHGISEPGPEVKCELAQVLQNRLDDAVLEVLSVMLARNPMCKLTPADVHFIQKPFKPPECITQLRIQDHCLSYIGALGYYLRQNILQFLYTPKYTESRVHYHFQDYSQAEGSPKRVPESNIFLYNQSHSSGSKGIACIALAITNENGEPVTSLENDLSTPRFPEPIRFEDFEDLVSTSVFDRSGKESPPLIEFRIWKQGRVNLESLLQKLSSAVKHAIWDLVTEYKFLAIPLTVPISEMEAEKDSRRIARNSDPITVSGFETGEEGKLHEIYRVTLAQWLRFALDIRVPAVKKHEVSLTHRHAIPVTVRELQTLIYNQAPDTSCRVFVLKNRQPFVEKFTAKSERNIDENQEPPVYVPYDFSKEDQGTYTKCILIARNFRQWKASYSEKIEPELLVPKDQKVLQKFNPLILDNSFVPRQWILLAEIQSDNITLYMYNWSKEKSEKLVKYTTGLGSWLSCRSSVYTNIIMQKLGIFHHRSGYQREQSSTQYFQMTDLDSLAKFPFAHSDSKDWTRSGTRHQSIKSNPVSLNHLVGQVMRDAKPSNYQSYTTSDPVMKAVYGVHDLRQREKKMKEDLGRLHAMWQSRSNAPNIPISITALNTFKQYSRLIHFCHTPLLFLPSWRFQSAATRDHSLISQPTINLSATLHQQLPQQLQARQEGKGEVVKWHQELCDAMLSDYKQYLQILGFNPVQVEGSGKNEDEEGQQCYYLKKSMLGGILLFEIQLSQPFFVVKLRIIECSRLQTENTSAMINQFTLSFVDACDKIKVNMHLHSFTYDFHLRCIHSYIAGTGSWSLQQGYHLTNFLDDFNKYYSKAPNYARNLVHSDVINIRDLVIPARTLYSYLLSHAKTYDMRVFEMTPSHGESQESSEYVLVNLKSTPLISYCDAQDTRYTDDFDVALIVSRLEQPPELEKTEISLKYYIMLTSKRELYPKSEVEHNKLGKFRTVYTIEKSTTSSGADLSEPSFETSKKSSRDSSSDLQDSSPDQSSMTKDSEFKDSNPSLNNNYNSSGAPTPPPVPSSPLTQNPNPPAALSTASIPHLAQIRQESINYLGYYSSHEQLMQQMIMSQADAARLHISQMIERGALECRTDLLWAKLLENKPSMTYSEFLELCNLAHVEPLANLDARLNPFVNQPITWYQALAKVLQNKYQDHHKQFNTPDGNVTHHLILPTSFLQAFMMLTIDLHTSRGDLCAVYRNSEETETTNFRMEDVYTLIEGFVNACCFHLWVGLCSQ